MTSLDPAKTLPIEQVVLDRIRRELQRCRKELGAAPRVLRAIQNALNDPGLTVDEQKIVRRFRGVSRASGTDEVAAVLAQRVRAALRAGLEAAVEELALEEVLASPAVYLVRRAEKTSEKEHSTNFDAALHEARGELDRFGPADDSSEREDGDAGLLVLAEEEIFDRVRERMKAILANGGSSVAFYEKDGSESLDDFARVPAAVEVVRIDGESTEIELRMIDLLQKLEELRDDEDDDRLVGKLFHDKYRIIRRIGKGGFGSVYEATDERGAGNRVAIKVMHPDKAASSAEFKSFKEEARRVTRLDHPNIVDWKVFDETPEGTQYFVMELLEGEELDRILAREEKLEPMRAARILLGVLDALRAAHRLEGGRSILHLDLKPRNLFIVPAREGRLEQVKVFDFGIGQLVGGDEEHDDGGLALDGDLHEPFDPDKSPSTINTRSSANAARWITDETGRRFRRCVSCTPEYASPEQSAHILCLPDAKPLDGRSDLYSLGVAAFRMLTGEYPFPPPLERADLLRIHCEEPFQKLTEADPKCPKRFARFVDRLLEKQRDARFADADAAWRELDLFVNPPAWKQALPFAVPAAAALLALIVWLATRDTADPRFAPRDAEHDVSLSSEPLYLGPEQRTAVIALGAYDEGEAGLEDPGSVSVLRERDLSTIAGFRATWLGEDRIELAVEDDWPSFAERIAETVLLAVDGASIDAFELRWLGPAAWSIRPARIGGREAREVAGRLAVDTHLQSLEVELSGPPELERDLLEVAAEVDGGERLVRATERSGDRLVCRFPLDALVPEDGRSGEVVRMQVSARDRAGRAVTEAFDIAFVGAPLGVTRLDLLDRGRAGEGGDVTLRKMGTLYHLKKKNRPQLLVETASEADLHWWIEIEGSDRRVLEERLERRRTFRVDLDGLEELDAGEGYNASIHVELEDASAVLRSSADRALIREVLRFRYFDEEPSVTASLRASGSGTAERQLSAGLIDYWGASAATLVLGRVNNTPIQVALRVEHPDGSESVFERSNELQTSARSDVSFQLAFVSEGRHELIVETFFLDTFEEVEASEPDWSATYEVVVDTIPPVVAFAPGATDELVLRAGDALERLEALLPEHAGARGASPIEVSARIVAANGREAVLARSQPFDPGTTVAPLEFEGPWPEPPGAPATESPDGDYQLVLEARDLAGNRAPPLVRGIVLARAPPALAIERPSANRGWEPRRDRWDVLFGAMDPNGLERVECVVVRASDGLRTVVPLSAFEPGTPQADLVGALAFSHSWSEAVVRVEFVARDRYGNETQETLDLVRLPLIAPLQPERLAVVHAGFDVEPMLLVRGNAGLPYRFGGQANDVENERFLRAGLRERYSAGTEPALAIEYPPGSIADFYLDEREVGVGQFLAFVRADEGYSDARWWPLSPNAASSQNSSGPSAERRAELVASLAALDPQLPVTVVTWDEACAYARFVGKRLPSWVEWEYAVRRGADARVFAAWDPAEARALPAAYRELDSAVVRGSGGNRSVEGFFDLDGNVSEWTSTPVSFEGSGTPSEGFREHLRRFWLEALAPEEPPAAPRVDFGRCTRFWYAGGSFDTTHHDFSQVDRADRGTRSPSVGFRCALSLVQYHESLESGASLAGRFAPEDP